MRRNYFEKIVKYMKKVYIIENELKKLRMLERNQHT